MDQGQLSSQCGCGRVSDITVGTEFGYRRAGSGSLSVDRETKIIRKDINITRVWKPAQNQFLRPVRFRLSREEEIIFYFQAIGIFAGKGEVFVGELHCLGFEPRGRQKRRNRA